MEEISFLTGILSFLTLVIISCGTFFLSKKIKFPYTVSLVIVGIILIPLSKIGFLSFIDDFRLTPDILFFVFLPILLFESAYNMNYRQVLKNAKSITSLAVFGLLISATLIATGLYFVFPLIGLDIPFMVCLLFGSLISATDPVAVLSLFKMIGAPRRLTLIFEGESLFNDGTSLALFLVVLGIMFEGNITGSSIIGGVFSFLSMMFGGIIFGCITGLTFSKIISKITNNEAIEITFTMVLAHLTFILSEVIGEHFGIPISGVISTTIAGIIIGNYGRYKISPKVEEYMENFWGFFAFLANSLVFILMGLTLSYINIDFARFIIPIFVVIIIVMASRAISVYIPLGIINFFKLEEKIPNSRQHLLSWGSLRGALAMMMVLMIPGVGDENYEKILKFQEIVGWKFDFSIRDFIMVITIGSIMFTLLIKATTIAAFMRKMKIDKLNDLEQYEFDEGKIVSLLKIIEKLKNSFEKGYITNREYEKLIGKYTQELEKSKDGLKKLLKKQKNNNHELVKTAISLHSLGIEKQYLKELFHYNEIDEKNFKYIIRKINRQIERLESGNNQLSKIKDITQKDYDIFEKIILKLDKDINSDVNLYIRNRAKIVITRKVIKELNELKNIDFGFDSKSFDDVIELYKNFNKISEDKKQNILSKNNKVIENLEIELYDKSLLKLEEK
ncbi:MAG: cation:proton antiporter, partial [Candidatus Gracilibacteria bacterium]|nr:cation:proton antiporter [Candidatus Gracilibacteria bacterium]